MSKKIIADKNTSLAAAKRASSMVYVDPRVEEREITEEEVAFVVAWFNGEITTKHLYVKLGKANSGSVHSAATAILRQAIRHGFVRIERVK